MGFLTDFRNRNNSVLKIQKAGLEYTVSVPVMEVKTGDYTFIELQSIV